MLNETLNGRQETGPSEDASVFTPRAPRTPVDVEVSIFDDIGNELHGRLGNVSDGGFMAECEVRQPIGAVVKVDLPDRGIARAEVRWSLGWRFGAKILSFETSKK